MRWRAAVSVAVVLCAAGGCARDGGRPAEGTGERSLVQLTDDVESAYYAYWDAWKRAQEAADPREPALAEVAADPLLGVLRSTIDDTRRQGTASKGTITHHLQGMEVDGDRRWVVSCVGLDSWLLYDRSSGALTDQLIDKPNQLVTLAFHRVGTGWKATSLYLGDDCE